MKKKLGMTQSKTRNYVFLIKLRVSIIRDVAIIILNTNKFELRLTFTLTDSNQTFECGYQLRTLKTIYIFTPTSDITTLVQINYDRHISVVLPK